MTRMRNFLIALAIGAVASASAWAADNSLLPVCNTGTCGGTAVETFANKDVAGVKFPKNILHDTLGNPLAMPTAGADALTNSTLGLATYNLPMVYNGTTWDRWRGDTTSGAWVNVKNATLAVTQSGTWNVTNISGTISLPTGASTATNQATANTALGAPGDTACATDNGSCSIEALIKRTNQNITTLNTTAGGAVPAGTNYIGQVGLNAATSGGWTPSFVIAANSNNATNLKASAGIVHAVQVFGIGSAPAYLKLYDKATSPTCGTDTPVKVIMIPAASTAANGAGAVSNIIDAQFSNGIGYCVVTGIANNDNTSVAAATFVVNIDWK